MRRFQARNVPRARGDLRRRLGAAATPRHGPTPAHRHAGLGTGDVRNRLLGRSPPRRSSPADCEAGRELRVRAVVRRLHRPRPDMSGRARPEHDRARGLRGPPERAGRRRRRARQGHEHSIRARLRRRRVHLHAGSPVRLRGDARPDLGRRRSLRRLGRAVRVSRLRRLHAPDRRCPDRDRGRLRPQLAAARRATAHGRQIRLVGARDEPAGGDRLSAHVHGAVRLGNGRDPAPEHGHVAAGMHGGGLDRCAIVVDAPTEVDVSPPAPPPDPERPPEALIQVTVSGPGLVTSSDGRMRCGRSRAAELRCSERIPGNAQTILRLRTKARPGARFARWSGACRRTKPICKLQPKPGRQFQTLNVTGLFRDDRSSKPRPSP